MAKGNMLLGYSRGSVGDVVMSRVKGQQVAKARNRKPANPKTNKQMAQRSSFIAPVKFFNHGVQALFKFAFSDKKVTESDFNAFMRNNSKNAFPITKAEYESTGFPALGNYMMTKGKLAEVPVLYHPDYNNFIGVPLGDLDEVETIGQLSTALIEKGIVEEGDIFTVVDLFEKVSSMDGETLVLDPSESPKWTIFQFIVDSTSVEYVQNVIPPVKFNNIGDQLCFAIASVDEDFEKVLHSVAFIRSRETALGLEVSTSYLHNGGYIDDYIAFRNTKAQVDKVLADWGATGDAILQGSIAKK